MPPAFNLLDEPWIPVRGHAGGVFDVNLADALLKARDYAALAETAPPNLIALHRLLLALLHRALTTHHGKWNDQDRARWFREGLPEAPIRAYLAQWRERFWLFHPSEPFMQVAALANEPETHESLFHSSTISINQFYGPPMFDHGIYRTDARDLIAVLRDLLGYFQFVPGGFFPGKKLKSSDKAGALVNTAAVMPIGANLSETLLLGLHPYDGSHLDDIPSWERAAPTVSVLRADPTLATGPNDRYTRQTRAVLFEADSDASLIQRLRIAAGVALNEDPNAPDPMACYRINREGKAIRISFNEGRSIWRDLPSLVPDPCKSHDLPAAILGWAANLYNALGQWDAPVQILTAGLASDQAKLLRWRAERIEMPQVMLTQADAAGFLRVQVRFAEEVYSGLRYVFSDMIAQTMPDPKHKDTRSRARDILAHGPAAAVYFSNAERALPRLMRQIAEGEIDAADSDWKTTLIDAANQSWTATRQSLGDSPAVLRADARTWPRFRGLLKTLVQPAAEVATEAATQATTEEVPT